MQDVMVKLVDLPLARMFVLAGIIFLLVAVMGRIEGKIEPGHAGRVGASIIGLLLMAVGLTMYFLDGDAMRDALREGAARTLAPEASAIAATKAARATRAADPTPAAPAARPAPAIKVVAGTFGKSCGAPAGNATAALARACDGRIACSFALDAAPAEGTTPGCERDYAAEWKCGSGAGVFSATIPAGAGHGASLTLACPAGG
ncbi:MAG TPA: hypothetical protein VEH51_15335 [Burkholderiales bacterium]|nr:hypothetical protein [Burkholderiales bacterium]